MKYGQNYGLERDPDYFAMCIDRTPQIKRVKTLVHSEPISRLYMPIQRIWNKISHSLDTLLEDEHRFL